MPGLVFVAKLHGSSALSARLQVDWRSVRLFGMASIITCMLLACNHVFPPLSHSHRLHTVLPACHLPQHRTASSRSQSPMITSRQQQRPTINSSHHLCRQDDVHIPNGLLTKLRVHVEPHSLPAASPYQRVLGSSSRFSIS